MLKTSLLGSLVPLTFWLLPAAAIVADGPAATCSCEVANVNVAHTGTPTGELKNINGGTDVEVVISGQAANHYLVDMYISYPAGNSTELSILYMTDIFGVKLLQNRL